MLIFEGAKVMRFAFSLLLSVLALICASAQSSAQTETPSDSPGIAKEITIEDLQGAIIDFSISVTGHTRWSGDHILRSIQYTDRFRIRIGSGGSISWTIDEAGRTGNDPWTRHYSFSEIIDRPATRPDVVGPRVHVWTFEGNTLTFLRVFAKGGRTIRILLSRVGSGLGCTAMSWFLQEVGAGNPTTKAVKRRGYNELIGVKQTSSTCRVSKK